MAVIPEDIRAAAEALRSAFGPGVKLLRVVGDDGNNLGDPKWDSILMISKNSTSGKEASPTP